MWTLINIDRKTVRNILNQIETKGCVERKERSSVIDQYKEYIEIQANKGLSAVRIFQDLKKDFDFEGGYDCVRKFVSQFKKDKKAYMVLHSLPGEEAQVDFGYIGTLNAGGKRKKAWIFLMTLSYSRYMYVEIVFDQKVQTFIECHRNSFKYFGGVPKIVKIDNLKAAILEADFYEPTVQKSYAMFATHYGFLPEPCRVYTPTDKGKIEACVNYVKDNCFKGREFESYDEAKEFLLEWLKTIANTRVHGTTKKVPIDVFKSTEKDKLISLPIEEFSISASKKCIVNTNCHIHYLDNYYSVPYAYIGQEVTAIEINNLLKIFFKEIEIALHNLEKIEKGQHITKKEHYPYSKNISSEDILSRQKIEMEQIGSNALAFFNEFLKSKPHKKYDYRSISGILSLRKEYDDKTLDDACHRANIYGALNYKTIKNICKRKIVDLPVSYSESYINEEQTELSRDLLKYDELAERSHCKNE